MAKLLALVFLLVSVSSFLQQVTNAQVLEWNAKSGKKVFDHITSQRHYDPSVRPPGSGPPVSTPPPYRPSDREGRDDNDDEESATATYEDENASIENGTMPEEVTTPTPSGPNSPVLVLVNIYVRSMSNFDIEQWTFDTQITFRQRWNDPRLRYNDKNGEIEYISLRDRHLIWTPDIFFTNEISAQYHDTPTPNTLIRIYPTGDVLYSVRLSLRLFCGPMDVTHFPFDRQECPLALASYGASTDDIVFAWKYINPIEVSSALAMADFSLQRTAANVCTSKTITGEYSCLRAEFLLRRHSGYWVDLVYWPTAMLLFAALIGFLFRPDQMLIRVTIGLVCFVAILCLNTMNRRGMPHQIGTRAVDLWMSGTEFGAATILLVYALIGWKSSGSIGGIGDPKNEGWERAARSVLPAVMVILMGGYTVTHYGINND